MSELADTGRTAGPPRAHTPSPPLSFSRLSLPLPVLGHPDLGCWFSDRRSKGASGRVGSSVRLSACQGRRALPPPEGDAQTGGGQGQAAAEAEPAGSGCAPFANFPVAAVPPPGPPRGEMSQFLRLQYFLEREQKGTDSWLPHLTLQTPADPAGCRGADVCPCAFRPVGDGQRNQRPPPR